MSTPGLMTGSNTTLSRLPARRRGVIRRASVWDAGDYLLSISGTSFSERYRRFYYRDIKAIVVQKGPRMGSIGAIILLAWLCLPFTVAAFSAAALTPGRWLLLAPFAWLFWIIYVNIARSCRVYVYTAVSAEELPAIFRRRSAARTLPKILNKIAQAQGTLSAAPAVENAGEPAAEAQPVEAIPVVPDLKSTEDTAAPVSSQIIYAASAFSLLLLASATFAYWYRNVPWNAQTILTTKIYFSALNALEVITGVWAVMKLVRVRVLSILRICIFAGLAILAVRTYMLVVLFTMVNQANKVLSDAMSQIGLRYWMGTLDCGFSLLVGIAGLICLMMTWEGKQRTTEQAGSGGFLSNP